MTQSAMIEWLRVQHQMSKPGRLTFGKLHSVALSTLQTQLDEGKALSACSWDKICNEEAEHVQVYLACRC